MIKFKPKNIAPILTLMAAHSFAAKATTFGGMASSLNDNFSAISALMINTAYVAGIGFGISAIFKFKQHKDNPQQIPIGTPFALLAVSILLVFLPGLYTPAAKSIYGTTKGVSGSLVAGKSADGLAAMPASK